MNNGYKRVLFIGLGAKNNLTEDRLRNSISAVGKELSSMKASSVAIWPTPFTNEKITNEDVVFIAAEGLGLGSISLMDTKQIPMNATFHLKQFHFYHDQMKKN